MNKSVMLITKCCGKGFYQAQELVRQLTSAGLVYNLHSTKPSKCPDILAQFDIDVKTKIPYIYVNDLMFKAEKINDKEYLKNLVDVLKKVDEGESMKDEEYSKIVVT
jgi:hypothetical protein